MNNVEDLQHVPLVDFAERWAVMDISTGGPRRMHLTEAMRFFLENAFFDIRTPRQPTIALFGTKASGKTSLSAMLSVWRAFSIPDSEINVLSTSRDSAKDRTLKAVKYGLKHDSELMRFVEFSRDRVEFANGSVIQILGASSGSVAGAMLPVWICDELWAWTSQDDVLRFDEASVRPGSIGFKFCASYAGISGSSQKLRSLWDIAQAGKLLDSRWGIYENSEAGIYAAFDTDEFGYPFRLPWLDDAALTRERSQMSPNTFNRTYLNRWSNISGQQLVTQDEWEEMFDSDLVELTI